VKGTNYHVGNPGATFNIGSTKSRVNRVLRQSRLLFTARHAWLSLTAGTSMAKNELRWETALLEGRETPAIERAWQTVRDALAEIRNLAQPAGVPVGVVIMPIPPQVARDRPQAKYQSRVREIAGSLGLFVVDPLPLFQDHRHDPKLFIPYDRLHTDSYGQQLIADSVFDTLKQLAPWSRRSSDRR
jgi:hypothetical protein